MASTDTTGSCIVCHEPNAQFCKKCKSARYCWKACQTGDWPTHKVLCAAYSRFDASSRPTEEHFRAILFPVNNTKPQLIWLPCQWSDDGTYQDPLVEPLFGANPSLTCSSIEYNSDTICICYRDTFLIDGSQPNKSVASMATIKSGQCHDWSGPIIAYGTVGLGSDANHCRDLDMNDFRHIADYLLSYNYWPELATPQPTDVKVKGVRINCVGDQKLFNKPHFEAVEASTTDLVFTEHDTSDISSLIGLPILTRRLPPDRKWARDEDNKIFKHESPFNNQDATFLHLCCDSTAKFDAQTGVIGWGLASMQWQNSVGSVLVVRQDKKPLSPLHVEALCNYCRNEILPLFSHSKGVYTPEEPISKEDVLSMICRPTFVIYWFKLLEKKFEKGENTNDPSPYEV